MLGQQAGSVHTWAEFAGVVGIPTAILGVVLVFIRQWLLRVMDDAKQREERMADRIDKLERFETETLLQLIGQCKEALVESTEVVRELHSNVVSSNESIKELLLRLTERPCLLPKDQQKE